MVEPQKNKFHFFTLVPATLSNTILIKYKMRHNERNEYCHRNDNMKTELFQSLKNVIKCKDNVK